MISNVYYFMAALSYGIFIIQFICSQLFGDLDVDMDIDGEPDFDVSSVVSFKGLIHFCMGCFGWLAAKQYYIGIVTYTDWMWSFLIGVIFLIVLYFTYKLVIKFNNVPQVNPNIVGKSGVVKYVTSDGYCISISNNGEVQEIIAKSKDTYNAGDTITIKKFEGGIYYI